MTCSGTAQYSIRLRLTRPTNPAILHRHNRQQILLPSYSRKPTIPFSIKHLRPQPPSSISDNRYIHSPCLNWNSSVSLSTTFAQTVDPYPLFTGSKSKIRLERSVGGVKQRHHSHPTLAGHKLKLRNITSYLSQSSNFYRFSSRSPSAFTRKMSNLSHPKNPVAPGIPLRGQREHHRLVERLTDRLETPSLDDRSYRVIKLPNQLEVLLVHDAETDKASAAMDVNVGNFSDPEDFPGMAHAVEVNLTLSNGY